MLALLLCSFLRVLFLPETEAKKAFGYVVSEAFIQPAPEIN